MLYQHRFPEPLIPGTLTSRYKRFFADVLLDDGRTVTAHCVNTGKMEGLTTPGLRVWLRHCPSPKRKLSYCWEIAEMGGSLYGTNTSIPNVLVRRMLEERVLPGLNDWTQLVPEKKYGANSRVDFWLEDSSGGHYLEVKNCHLVYPDGGGYFPDCVSARATRHLEELMEVVREGHRATVLFIVQCGAVKWVTPSDRHDPVFAKTARHAAREGVCFRALRIDVSPHALAVMEEVPVTMNPVA